MSLLRIKQADGSWENIPAIKGADGIDGKDGAIQYTAGRYIQIDEDTQTINCTVKIGDLVIIDAVPVKDSTNVVSSGGVYDALEAKADKTEIAGLGSEAGFITNSVEDLKNYYKKSETYSQDEVNSLLGNLTRLTLQVVQELPETGTEHIIYLVPNNESGNNVFEEWVFVQSKWEMIGTTEVDLSNYYTKEEIDALIEASGKSAEIYTVVLNYGNVIGSIKNSTCKTNLQKLVNDAYKAKKPFVLKLEYAGNHITTADAPFYVLEQKTDYYIIESFLDNISLHLIGTWSASGYFSLNYAYREYTNNENYLSKTNTTNYIPTKDYHPATKKYVDDKILDAIPQKSEIPTASADYLDKIYQYIGEDTEEFTKGFFYQCISETAEDGTVTYSWSELKFNAGGNTEESGSGVDYIYEINTGVKAFDLWENTTSFDTTNIKNVIGEIITDIQAKFLVNTNFAPILKLNFIHDNRTSYNQALQSYILMGLTKYAGYGYFGADNKASTIYFSCRIVNQYMSTSRTNTQLLMTVNGSWNGTETFTPSSVKFAKEDVEFLSKTNTDEYVPTGDYNPATKKYVDDAVANAGGSGGESGGSVEALRIDYYFDGRTFDTEENRTILSDYYNRFKKGESPELYIGYNAFQNTSSGSTNSWLYRVSVLNIEDTYMDLTCTPVITHSASSNNYGVNYNENHTLNVFADISESDGTYTVTYIGFQDSTNYSLSTRGKILGINNTTEYTPTGDYNPATKKYVDDAVANAGGGSGEGTDLSNYYNKEEVDAKVAPLVSATDVLTKTNTTEYVPASAYHPATKQYVDQTVAGSGAITEEADPTVPLYVKNITQDMITKWNNAPTEEDVTNAATAAVNGAGFIKSETDPAFQSSAASGILDSDIENWNGKADLKDIDSALIAASGANFSVEVPTNPFESTVSITMTEDLNQLVSDCKTSVDNGESPKFNLKVTYNGMTEDLHFKYYKSTSQKDKLYFKALTSIQPESNFHTYHSTPFLTAIIEMYNLTSTNKSMDISYEDLISVRSLSDANAYTPAPWGDDFVAYPSSRIEDPIVTLTTTLDIANLNGYYQFEKSTSSSLPSLIAPELILGIKGSNICINFEPSGTSITKGRAQTFTEMMDSIKITDETSRDVGKYILAETYISCNVSDYITIFTKNGQYEQVQYRNTILGKLGVEDNHVYLRGSESGQIIVAKLVEDGDYDSADNYLASGIFRMTLEIDPDENKALASSTVDLGKITGMHRKEIIETDCAAYGGVLIRPYINETSSNKISALSFCALDLTKETVWE